MKKIALILGTLLVMLAALSLVSCEGTGPDKPKKEDGPSYYPKTPLAPVLSSEFQTFYLNIADAGLDGLEGFHFKNKSNHEAGFVIQKIFASDAMSETDSIVAWDFTQADPKVGAYWGFGDGTIENGVWSSGAVAAPAAAGGETYITGFASGVFSGKVFVGIVAKNLSAEVKGDDVVFVPIIGDPQTDKEKAFAEFFGLAD